MAGGLLLGLFPVNVLHNVIHLVFGDTFGLVPVGGHDIWLHGVIGVLLTFVGFGWARGVARA